MRQATAIRSTHGRTCAMTQCKTWTFPSSSEATMFDLDVHHRSWTRYPVPLKRVTEPIRNANGSPGPTIRYASFKVAQDIEINITKLENPECRSSVQTNINRKLYHVRDTIQILGISDSSQFRNHSDRRGADNLQPLPSPIAIIPGTQSMGSDPLKMGVCDAVWTSSP